MFLFCFNFLLIFRVFCGIGKDEDGNLPAEELKRKIERLSRQSAQMLTQLALSDLQLRALNMGQDRFRRRLWILPHAGGVYLEAMESGEANAGPLVTWDGKPAPPIGPRRSSADDQDPADAKVKSEEPISNESVQPETEQKVEPMEEEEILPAAVKTEESACHPVKIEQDAVPSDDVEMKEEAEDVTEPLPVLWFSLLPRTPCDVHQSPAGKSNSGFSDGEEESDGLASKKKEESAAKEEAEKIVMQPIPEGISRLFFKLFRTKTFICFLN